MDLRIKKRIWAKLYAGKIIMKHMFYKKAYVDMERPLKRLFEEYRNKKKIVVFCSGPSGKKATIDKECLYLVTNDGYKSMLEKDVDYLLYLNDNYTVRRILASNSKYKKGQNVIFYFSASKLHKAGWAFLESKLYMLRHLSLFFLLEDEHYDMGMENFRAFEAFYNQRNLEIKIQNSGMFLLLFGFYIADTLKLPLEIFGLDLGVGGSFYSYASIDGPGKSVTRDRVKVNVKMYLDYIYRTHFDVKNYSNFYGNQTGMFFPEIQS